MKIFIRGNGGAFGRSELLDFVRAGLRGPWYKAFRAQGEVVSCHILHIMDMLGSRSEYHGLVEVRPGTIGWKLIQKLNGERLHGKAVLVRKWFERNESNDRRKRTDLNASPHGRDRRQHFERRRLVQVEFLSDLPLVVRNEVNLGGNIA